MSTEHEGGVPLAEAAQHLGIREELVRQRIYRSKLKGYKVEGRWYVVLPPDETGSDTRQDDAPGVTRQGQADFTFATALIGSQEQ